MKKHLWANLKYKWKISLVFGSQCFQDSVFLCLIFLSVNKFGVFGIVKVVIITNLEQKQKSA